jgi:hypothetical protein
MVTDKMPLGQMFLPVLLIPSVSVTPPMLRNYLHLNTALIRRTSGRSLDTFKQNSALSDIGGALILEEGTDRFSRNVGTKLLLFAA